MSKAFAPTRGTCSGAHSLTPPPEPQAQAAGELARGAGAARRADRGDQPEPGGGAGALSHGEGGGAAAAQAADRRVPRRGVRRAGDQLRHLRQRRRHHAHALHRRRRARRAAARRAQPGRVCKGPPAGRAQHPAVRGPRARGGRHALRRERPGVRDAPRPGARRAEAPHVRRLRAPGRGGRRAGAGLLLARRAALRVRGLAALALRLRRLRQHPRRRLPRLPVRPRPRPRLPALPPSASSTDSAGSRQAVGD